MTTTNTIDPDVQCPIHGCARWRCDSDHPAQYRAETHGRYENLRLIEAVVGRRSWDDDSDTAGGIVSRYPDRASAQHDADRLSARGLQVSVSSGNLGMPDAGNG